MSSSLFATVGFSTADFEAREGSIDLLIAQIIVLLICY